MRFLLLVVILFSSAAQAQPRETRDRFYQCIVKKDLSGLKRMVQADATLVTLLDNFYGTPLNTAVRSGTPEMVSYLLNHGAKVNYRESIGFTPLAAAAASRQFESAIILLQHGALLNAQEDMGRTPLHLAVENGDVKMIRFFLDNNAALEVKNKAGRTPLAESVRQGRPEVIAFLLQRGANVHVLLDGRPLSQAPHPRGPKSPEAREVQSILRQYKVP